MNLIERINQYPQHGGNFNPEMMDHQAVRQLLIDCRDDIYSTQLMVSAIGDMARSGAEMPAYDQYDHCRLRDKFKRVVEMVECTSEKHAMDFADIHKTHDPVQALPMVVPCPRCKDRGDKSWNPTEHVWQCHACDFLFTTTKRMNSKQEATYNRQREYGMEYDRTCDDGVVVMRHYEHVGDAKFLRSECRIDIDGKCFDTTPTQPMNPTMMHCPKCNSNYGTGTWCPYCDCALVSGSSGDPAR